ncbi:UDP-glucose/GDP-mannose dehydrogenase family protein [Kordiimonas sp. SCSIO 12603]|uniref:UDP-glucose dehydrogenase family protein n=1 Tax=Kordiimonas sp. SCSIO 12603 TaxID=2829596 RepID=UPI0021034A4C|nr:UDP-glucose/GDP-mannose dehydrogenase family protein [Kordiimonas sp. SCSIO 12603]UTW59137.1 UDP-glucose/GDP-mannose dehydrogenase family protein [Kordiimonas sp. SCSIO 12603]
MKIAVIGTGYVGLVSGTCFSEFGHTVTCVDKDAGKIERLHQGIMPIYEPGLDVMVERNTEAGRLFFTTDLKEAMEGAEAVFIAVGTPSRRGDGHADLQYVFAAVEELAEYISDYTVIVTKSTVPVGTGAEIIKRLEGKLDENLYSVASNPEFLREGAAIEDFMRPDRVVVGIDSDRAKAVMSELYRPLFLNETPVVFTNRETSELIKYAANAFLATKISFINEMADMCEKVGADIQQVSKGIGLDNRIGGKFLHAGPGFGGSCFPKDTRAIVHSADDYEVPMKIIRSVIEVNEERKLAMADKVIKACGGSVEGKRIAVLGLTFKPNTDDMRESPSLDIIPALQKAGAEIHAFDPKGMEEAKHMLEDVSFHDEPYSTMEDADATVIITEWNQFRALDFGRMKDLMKSPVLVDLRNIYGKADMTSNGFDYTGIGR